MKLTRPKSLTVVAWLFIAVGVVASYDMVRALFGRSISLNLAASAVAVGIALLRGREFGRGCARVFTWVALVMSAAMLITVLFAAAKVTIGFGTPIEEEPAKQIIGSFFALGSLAVNFWIYTVLVAPRTQAYFSESIPSDSRS